MSNRPVRSRVFRILLCLLMGVGLTGCGSGQSTQTADQQAAVNGAYGDVGDGVALRDVWIPFPPDRQGGYSAGSTVPVVATIVNYGRAVDDLVAVASPVASEVTVSGGTRIPPGRNLVVAPDGGQVRSPLVFGTVHIALTMKDVLPTGLNTPVTFRFRNAGEVTLPVPMAE